MNALIGTYLIVGLVILVYVTLIWLTSLKLRNASIVDIFWGMGFVISAWVYFALTPDGLEARKLLLLTLTTIWGLRLSLHILRRNWKKPEDFRYRKWREENGQAWWWKSYFNVFILQGALMWIISMPLLAAQIAPGAGNLTILDFIGVLIWGIGFFFEAVGDWQLGRFVANPANKGKVLSTGVWRYTRHPNYFGDAAQWWGYYLLALSAGGWWSIFSPLLMNYLLRYVSGAALLEKSMITKPQYKEYMETTPIFVPWFPRKPRPQ